MHDWTKHSFLMLPHGSVTGEDNFIYFSLLFHFLLTLTCSILVLFHQTHCINTLPCLVKRRQLQPTFPIPFLFACSQGQPCSLTLPYDCVFLSLSPPSHLCRTCCTTFSFEHTCLWTCNYQLTTAYATQEIQCHS